MSAKSSLLSSSKAEGEEKPEEGGLVLVVVLAAPCDDGLAGSGVVEAEETAKEDAGTISTMGGGASMAD